MVDDVNLMSRISSLACLAISISGCLDNASAGISFPLICIRSISMSFILCVNASMVLVSRLDFFMMGRWSVKIVVLEPLRYW